MNKSISVLVVGILATGLIIPLDAFADVAPPNTQVRLGIAEDKVICKANLFKLIKNSDGTSACVKPETAKKLVKNGWAKQVDTSKIDQFIQKIKNRAPIGTVNILTVLKQTVQPRIASSSPAVDSYHVVFEVCSNEKPIRLPEVILSSQTETRYVKLAEMIPAETCQINAGKIKAINKDTIEVNLVNKGGVTAKLIELETRVNELTNQLTAEKSELTTKYKETGASGDFTPAEGRITKIVELRADLKSAKDELNRYLFAHNIIPKIKVKDLEPSLSIAGTPLTGIVVNKLSATPQLVQENGFDVVFEMCAGPQIVRIPSVTVSSDMETKTVRLADKISPESCQMSGAKILASSGDIIEVNSGESILKSPTATGLEEKITSLTKELQAQKQALKDLTHLNPRPADFNDQALEITTKIIDLRGEITLTKAKLYNLLNHVLE